MVTWFKLNYIPINNYPYKQLSLKGHSFQKLGAKFYGPFKILARVGTVAYTLELPSQPKIHSTFHISQLKMKFGCHHVSTQLPIVHTDYGHVVLALQSILDRRLAPRHGRAITQVLSSGSMLLLKTVLGRSARIPTEVSTLQSLRTMILERRALL